jgi:hypothetical protein
MLKQLKDSGVPIHKVKDIQHFVSGIVLRHDMDDEMMTAIELAQMEYDMGIEATFYFLLSCPSYNLFSPAGREIVNELRGMGHEIGLHFDPSVYEDVNKGFRQEVKLIQLLLGDEVSSFATHAPSLHGLYPEFDDIINAYDKELFSSDNYFSDSRLMFNANIEDIIEKARTGLVQVLFHPISYYFRDENKAPNIISLYKNIIERFGNNLLEQVSNIPAFSHEIEEYPTKTVTIDVRIK